MPAESFDCLCLFVAFTVTVVTLRCMCVKGDSVKGYI